MDYITQLTSFYNVLETKPLSGSAILLWHGLMATANKTGWIDIFTVASSTLQSKTALSRRTIERARSELARMGYIDWIEQGGNQAAMYQIRNLAIHSSPAAHIAAQAAVHIDALPVVHIDAQPVAITKQDKTKQNKTNERERGEEKPSRFVPPTLSQVENYCNERHNTVNAQTFINFYTSKNWYVGHNKMSNWQASVRTWEQKEALNQQRTTHYAHSNKQAIATAESAQRKQYIENMARQAAAAIGSY